MSKKRKKKEKQKVNANKQQKALKKKQKATKNRIENPPEIVQVLGDVPIVEDGFRMVSPAQAMMNYAAPLREALGELDSVDELNNVLYLSQVCWNLALSDDDEMKYDVIDQFKEIGFDDAEQVVEMMILRHRQMYPDEHERDSGGIGFYLKERLIDPPQEYVPFKESKLEINEVEVDRNEDDEEISKILLRLNENLPDENINTEDLSFDFSDKASARFAFWCQQKGIQTEVVEAFLIGVERFIHYASQYVCESLDSISSKSIHEFMNQHFICKVHASPEDMSAMPVGLIWFYRFLTEQKIIQPERRIIEDIESEKLSFQRNLRKYHFPS